MRATAPTCGLTRRCALSSATATDVASFVCFVTTNAPHSPYIVDERYSDPYVGQVEHQDRANFYGMITCIDENLGFLRAKARASGAWKRTRFSSL